MWPCLVVNQIVWLSSGKGLLFGRKSRLRLGVIGTTYAYAFQKQAIKWNNALRDSKKGTALWKELLVDLLDGRYHSKWVKTSMIPMRFMWRKLIWNMNLFFWVCAMACQRSRGNLAKNNIKGTPRFLQISGIHERCPRVGRRIMTIFCLSWGHMQEDHLMVSSNHLLEGE